MTNDVGDLARKLARIQAALRKDLVKELQEQDQDLEVIFDPYAYSPVAQELRDKYLSRLYLIQGLLQQLAEFSQGHNRRATRVLSVVATDQQALVRDVNRQLLKLNGTKVLDVKFIPVNDGQEWSALITFEVNPFTSNFDETAAWM
jgi:hypothetical protein